MAGIVELLNPAGVLSDKEMFVCSYFAELGNLHGCLVDFTRRLCANPHGCLVAVNSNFGHAAQPGFEQYLKVPRAPDAPEDLRTRGRVRKVVGDRTCFYSAIELVIRTGGADIPEGKVYFIKCFPATGRTQIPGVILNDLSDGHIVLAAFVDYLNEMRLGDAAPADALAGALAGAALGAAPADACTCGKVHGVGAALPVVITNETPVMLNYKFMVTLARANALVPLIIDLHQLALYLCAFERHAELEDWVPVVPPFQIHETKTPVDDVKVSFLVSFPGSARRPRVKFFHSGKVNILGAKTEEMAQAIHEFFRGLFVANWPRLVSRLPQRDTDRAAA